MYNRLFLSIREILHQPYKTLQHLFIDQEIIIERGFNKPLQHPHNFRHNLPLKLLHQLHNLPTLILPHISSSQPDLLILETVSQELIEKL